MKTLIFNAKIQGVAHRDAFIDRGFIEIHDGRIRNIGQGDPPNVPERDGATLFDADGKLVIPGLVNGHTHLAMSLLKGLGEDLPLIDWLFKVIHPVESRFVDPGFVSLGTRLALLECIRCGVTSIADMYYFGLQVADAIDSAGLRGWVGQVVSSRKIPDSDGNLQFSFANMDRLLGEYLGHHRIVPVVAPHSTYLEDDQSLKAIAQFAKQRDLMVHSHASESQEEQKLVARNHNGATPVEVFQETGFGDLPLVLAHGVYLSNSDIDLLKGFRHVGVIHNPESNMKLGSGIANVGKLLDEELLVGLGTDSNSSNNDLDLLSEMDVASKLQKVDRLDSTAFPTETVFRTATLGGAEVLGVANQMGSLEPGKKADLCFIDLRQPHLIPFYDALSSVVFSARGGDVSDLMVDGKWVMRNRVIETLDENAILEEAQSYGLKIGASLEDR